MENKLLIASILCYKVHLLPQWFNPVQSNIINVIIMCWWNNCKSFNDPTRLELFLKGDSSIFSRGTWRKVRKSLIRLWACACVSLYVHLCKHECIWECVFVIMSACLYVFNCLCLYHCAIQSLCMFTVIGLPVIRRTDKQGKRHLEHPYTNIDPRVRHHWRAICLTNWKI